MRAFIIVLCHSDLYKLYERQNPQRLSRYPPKLELMFPLNPSHSSPPTRARWQQKLNLDWLGGANELY